MLIYKQSCNLTVQLGKACILMGLLSAATGTRRATRTVGTNGHTGPSRATRATGKWFRKFRKSSASQVKFYRWYVFILFSQSTFRSVLPHPSVLPSHPSFPCVRPSLVIRPSPPVCLSPTCPPTIYPCIHLITHPPISSSIYTSSIYSPIPLPYLPLSVPARRTSIHPFI